MSSIASATSAPAPMATGYSRREQRSDTLAMLSFVLLFPAFFYYQSAVAVGFVSNFLGGYFTAGAAVTLPLLLAALSSAPYLRKISSSAPTTLFAAFMVIFGGYVVVGGLTGANPEITSTYFAYLFKFTAIFLTATLVNGQSPSFQRLCQLLFLGVVVTALTTAADGKFLAAAITSALGGDFFLDYQGLAYAYIVMLIFAAPSLKYMLRLCLYAASVVALFLIGARSEFAGFIVIALVIEFCKARSRPRFVLTLGIMAGVAALAFVQLADTFADHRIFALLEVDADQSVIERNDLQEDAVATIEQNPIFGKYASYEQGHYAHNILSAWVDFGLLGFLILAGFLATMLGTQLRMFRTHARHDLYVQSLACTVFTVLLMLVAKHYTYQMIPVAAGLAYRLHCKLRAPRADNPSAEAGLRGSNPS
ncbi:O-antigen ligase family protein [Roseateles asaccharophilus]|uniref:O-antigen ligase n=1 Tax=Roseateles asaccharophilus TaxID=582607 RepID=A0ABU2AC33_9BURK|nr:O-antigen ligase family protein [Roseateles asaccharophilus]MDR7334734.1 O-antigen ligase [Roseateles asaccharophilus]